MKEIISTGKNIEKAIQNGLNELNAKFEDVSIEVISEGGFFSKAKVKITYQEDEALNSLIADEKQAEESVKEQRAEAEEKRETVLEKSFESESKKESEKNGCENKTCSKKFLEELFKIAKIDVDIQTEEVENYIKLSINGQNLSSVIGNKGECLSALQYIASLVKGEVEKGKKIILDAGDYKKSREEKLKSLAEKLIEKVKETGKSEKLKPMTAYERRIIHEVVSNTEGVRSESRGTEPNRFLTIYPDQN